MKQKMLILLAVLMLLLAPATQLRANAAETGTCGENLTWTLDDAGTLTISGTGAMFDYSYEANDLPDGSTSPWYSYREDIQSVVVEEGVTTIGDYAFNCCSSLDSIPLPDSITSIGLRAFNNCTSLSSITIPDGVTTIGNYAFDCCTNLSSITIPDSVTSIGQRAFNNCTSLGSITIPGSVTSIDDCTFYCCESLGSITVSEGVASIGGWAFYSCESLRSITLPDSVTSIGDSAFYGCINLSLVHYTGTEEEKAEISIGSNNSKLEDAQWHYECTGTNCPELPSVEKTGTCGENLTWTLDDAGTLTISGTGAMDDYSFYTDKSPAPWYSLRLSVLSVVVEDGVTSIGKYAFRSCTNLSSVTIPGSVTSIGESAFNGCTNLSSITIPEGVTSISNDTFSYCTNLSSITLPVSVTRIGNNAFNDCESLSSITIPEGVTSIGSYAFFCCSSMSCITIPDSVTTIGGAAFFGCKSLGSITIPEGVTSISWDTFGCCTNLSSITLPVSVTRIGEWAFDGCKNLSVVHYAGTEAQSAKISIDVHNSELENAQWHYECDGTNCPGSEPGKPTTPPAEGSFVDVAAGSYYYTPVLWAVEQGITNGLDATHFAPDATCTRAQVVTFLWRAKGCPEPKMIYNPFSDVSSSDYYYTAVLWAVENGITTGTGGNTFAPNEGCTRKQVATFLWRAQGSPASGGSNSFTDVASGAYYYDAVLWAVENGITSGLDATHFGPNAACSRGQIVTFLYRTMK